jgi:arginyl-tRNA synthetase
MTNYKTLWKNNITVALEVLAAEMGVAADADFGALVIAETPPNPELGDLGFPLFSFAKIFRKTPPVIAEALVKIIGANRAGAEFANAKAVGPYINIFLDRSAVAKELLDEALESVALKSATLAGKRIMVEFSSPNTNKPLHLGHLRNDVLGESISRILAACGAAVRKVSVINDRGVHICKSMLAYQKFGDGKTPESEGLKSDHFVGKWYVKFNQWSKEEATAGADEQAQALLIKWEQGDAETVALWKKMNAWALDGMKETYARTGISFDKYYFESDIYLRGKAEVLKGLEKGLFYRDADGAVWADLSADKLDKKVLLRKDGTSVYITQDFGLAVLRHEEWPFNRLVYVVGSEQNYHFQVLFILLGRLGFDWSKNLYHLSYGMVKLPEGKMKSREGTVVDADILIDDLQRLALDEMRDKERLDAIDAGADGAAATADKIAIGALHYYLLQTTPTRDMLFDPKESLSFNGNTGPYLQYSCARISSILARAGDAALSGAIDPSLLTDDAEWELIKSAVSCTEAIENAAAQMDPSVLCAWLYELAKNFSRFYHDCPILNATGSDGHPSPALAATRLALCKAILRLMRETLRLVCIPFIESM